MTAEKRSEIMRSVHSDDTSPEKAVRSWLHRQGYRFRLHPQNLPGRPDVVLPRYKAVIFVNGCFWHRHPRCRRATTPKTNQDFWNAKFEANVSRDDRVREELEQLGWRVAVVWECEVRDGTFAERLTDWL